MIFGQVPPVPEAPIPQVPGFDPNLFWGTLSSDAKVFIVLAALTAAFFVVYPLVRAIARRLEGKTVDPKVKEQLEQLQSRVTEIDQLHSRMAELEERVDFSERLLAQTNQPAGVERKVPS